MNCETIVKVLTRSHDVTVTRYKYMLSAIVIVYILILLKNRRSVLDPFSIEKKLNNLKEKTFGGFH